MKIAPAQAPLSSRLGGNTLLVFLLFLAAMISYIDRGSLSVAAPVLTQDMGLSPVSMGFLLSAFFWTYAAVQIFTGWLTDRFSVRWVFAWGYLLWALATFASGLAGGFASLFAFRLLLGAGEAVQFPCFSRIIASSFPLERRALPNAILDAGTKIGPAIAVLGGGLIIADYGWRMIFFVMGGLSLLWLVPWIIWGPHDQSMHPSQTLTDPDQRAHVTFMDILRRREAWGAFIGASSYTYAYYFLLTWLPSYLVQERHMSLSQMGVLGSMPYLLSAAAAILTGWISDSLIREGASATMVRKSIVIGGLLLSTLALPSAVVSDLRISLALLSIAYIAFGIFASNHWAISQTLAGPGAAGKWSGLQNCLGALTGVAAPIITGYVIQTTGSYYVAFVVTAVFAVIGALCYLLLVGPVAPLNWRHDRAASST